MEAMMLWMMIVRHITTITFGILGSGGCRYDYPKGLYDRGGLVNFNESKVLDPKAEVYWVFWRSWRT